MKKAILNYVAKSLMVVAICGAGSLATAQDAQFGIKGGVNFSNIVGGDDRDNIDDENVLTSFHVGIFTQVGLSDVFYIQPELLYTRKGTELDLGAIGDTQLNLDYLELPIMFRIEVLETINLEAGPYAAYLLNSKITNDNSSGAFELDTDDFRKLDYGLAIGAGFDLEILEIGARYNYGLVSLSKNDEGIDARNSSLSAYVAFKF
jgi:hypothetical protein